MSEGMGAATRAAATSDVAELIPRRTLRTLSLFGVNQFLRLENHESG